MYSLKTPTTRKRKSILKKIQCILTALFLLPMTTFANPMPHGVPVLTPMPKLSSKMSHKVALVEELVQIYDRLPSYVPSFMPEGKPRNIGAVGYKGKYTFFNHSSKKVTLRIIFPHVGTFDGGLLHDYNGMDKVTFRQKKVKVKVTKHLITKKLFKNKLWKKMLKIIRQFHKKNPIRISKKGVRIRRLARADYLYVFSFKLTFPPKRKSILTITYKAPFLSGEMGFLPRKFAYILQTGGYWYGKIKRCRIFIHMPKGFTRKDYTLSLSGAKVRGRRIVYDFGNFVPKKDLLVEVRR